jgi:anti-anti-sigma factor
MSDRFTISRSKRADDVPVLALRGRFEAPSSQKLRELVLGMKSEGHRAVIINLEELSFIGSSGLAVLLLLTEEFDDLGGKVVFAGANPSVQHVIDLLNVGEFLEIVPTVDDAIAPVSS